MTEPHSEAVPTPSAPDPSAAATARTPGFDVARAIAILGMVLVNYRLKAEPADESSWLSWSGDQIEGRAAALFVVLAGVGVSLRSRRAREDPGGHLATERRALLSRAGILFGIGLANLHMWEWDILHFYGVYLVAAALFLRARGWILWAGVGVFIAAASFLQARYDYATDIDVWSLKGFFVDLVFSGVHPALPWTAFLLVGMWLGRLDLKDPKIRRRLLFWSIAVASLGELADTVGQHVPSLVGLDDESGMWLYSFPRPPGPGFVATATAISIAVICIAVGATEKRPSARWVLALTVTGQLAFTLYILHAVAILIPLQHELLYGASLRIVYAYALAFYVVGIALSIWWRNRWEYGPLEGLIRQVAGRSARTPWGGERLGNIKPPE